MKISFVSDIHLECEYQTLPGGEVLILAGDICEAKNLVKDFNKTRPEQYTPGTFPYYDFFYTECAKYKQVFYVMGNHEHYHGRFDQTYDKLKTVLPSNVTLLENEVVEYCGVVFLGATLWTNCNNGDALTLFHLKNTMNDYRTIRNHYVDKDVYHKLTPEHTFETHVKTMEYFCMALGMHRDKPVVVITHHAPTHKSISSQFINDTLMNGGYASDLSEDILDHDNIRFWIHGHMHDPVNYQVGNCTVISNPKGYDGWDLNFGSFKPDRTIDV
jgi:Icc-related predicted phosphoesterase